MHCIDEQTLDRLTEEVYRRLTQKKLRIKRIGGMPPTELDAEFVQDSSFDVPNNAITILSSTSVPPTYD